MTGRKRCVDGSQIDDSGFENVPFEVSWSPFRRYRMAAPSESTQVNNSYEGRARMIMSLKAADPSSHARPVEVVCTAQTWGRWEKMTVRDAKTVDQSDLFNFADIASFSEKGANTEVLPTLPVRHFNMGSGEGRISVSQARTVEAPLRPRNSIYLRSFKGEKIAIYYGRNTRYKRTITSSVGYTRSPKG
jgi:hypothetical protein